MKITPLEILDIQIESIDEFRVKFADEIITSILPYISKNISEKVVQLKKIRKQIKKKRNNALSLKKRVDNLKKLLDRKRKIKLLLDRASKLIELKAVDDNDVKREIIVMLEMIEELPSEKIDYFVGEMMRIIMNKFSKMDNIQEIV
jgi:hypothetical protein